MGFAHDANGRQIKATRASVPDAWTVYDALGNRVATKINDVRQYMVYDALGKLVAEYGVASEGVGGVKYVQQDWQGSVRTIANNNGFVVGRTDHQAFGNDVGYGVGQRSVEQGYSVGKVARQGYGLTERDDATGLDHTWFRKNENKAGRWTSPDPYNGSMNLGDPQSFNRYSYVQSDPTNFVDPSGLNLVSYFCYDIVTTGHYTNQPNTTYVHTETHCVTFGGGAGGSSGGDIDIFGGGGHGGLSSPPSLELVDKNALNTCLEMLYGLKADRFGASVTLSSSGKLSTTAEETTYEANFSVLEPGAKPVAELKMILVGKPHGKGEITLNQAQRDKEGDLNAMLYGLGVALQDPAKDVGNYEYGAGYKVKKPGTPSALKDCYRRYAPQS